MTCIAYRDGVMAADTEMSIGDIKSRCDKIAKKKGHLIGMCGTACPPLATFLEAFTKRDEEARKLMNGYSFSCLVVTPKGELQVWDEKLVFEPLKVPFYALGCGGAVALGAMEMGASARRAVGVAIKWSVSVSGPVTTLRLTPKVEK